MSVMRTAFIQLHLAVLLAGFTGILGRLITLNEGLLVWYRLLFTAVTMWVVFGLAGRLKRIPAADKWKITGVGMLAACHWVLFYGSIKYANVSVALVCFSAIGFFTALLEPLVTRRPFVLRELLLGLFVMAGIYIIFRFDPTYKTGIVLGLGSALLGALFPVFNRQLMQRMNAETLLAWEITGGFLCLSAVLPFYLRQFPVSHFWPGWSNLAWLLVLSWLCSVWAFQLSANALKQISAFTVNLSYNLEPVYGIIMAFIFFRENEQLSVYFFAGLLIILTSVLLQTWFVYRSRRSR